MTAVNVAHIVVRSRVEAEAPETFTSENISDILQTKQNDRLILTIGNYSCCLIITAVPEHVSDQMVD